MTEFIEYPAVVLKRDLFFRDLYLVQTDAFSWIEADK